jgi:hypothetical protein
MPIGCDSASVVRAGRYPKGSFGPDTPGVRFATAVARSTPTKEPS